MCTLQITMQCCDRCFEVLPAEVENAELVVEDAMSHVLLDLFGEGTVDDVTIRFSSNSRIDLQHCSIQIRAQCPCGGSEPPPRRKKRMKLAVEKSISALLKELFGSVSVDNIALDHAPLDYHALSWGV